MFNQAKLTCKLITLLVVLWGDSWINFDHNNNITSWLFVHEQKVENSNDARTADRTHDGDNGSASAKLNTTNKGQKCCTESF